MREGGKVSERECVREESVRHRESERNTVREKEGQTGVFGRV